jgi:hypothetical protein
MNVDKTDGACRACLERKKLTRHERVFIQGKPANSVDGPLEKDLVLVSSGRPEAPAQTTLGAIATLSGARLTP